MIIWLLFLAWFQIGLFNIGSAYSSLPLIKYLVVDSYGWLTIAEFTDLIVIDEMAPGPILLNAATFVGTQVAGFPGALVSTIACLLGPAIILSIIAYFYFKYEDLPLIKTVMSVLRPVTVALIASAGLSIIIPAIWGSEGFSFDISSMNFVAVGIACFAFFILRKYKWNPVLVLLGCGALGGVLYTLI
jgi:Chromate transport protein ChrA